MRQTAGRTGWLAALAGLGVYMLLGQRILYGDAPGILLCLGEGQIFSGSTHALYAPLAFGLWQVLEPFGVTLFQATSLLSALGTAIGLAFLHAASRQLGMTREAALLTMALVGSCPAVVFFATVVELHGCFFAFSSLATLAMARLITHPSLARALVLGLSSGLASMAHATGNLLPFVFCLLFLCLSPAATQARGPVLTRGQKCVLCLAAIVAHAAFALLASGVLRLCGLPVSSAAGAAGLVLGELWYLVDHAWDLPASFLWEWLLPFLPLSGCALAGLGICRVRSLALVVLAGALLYVFVAFLLVRGGNEFGAYLLPLAWPAALVASRMLPSIWCCLLAFFSLVGAVGYVATYDDHAPSQEAANDLRSFAGERPMCLLAVDNRDLEVHFVWLPEAEILYLPPLLLLDEQAMRMLMPVVDARIEAQLDRDRAVFMTGTTRELLLSPEVQARTSGAAAFLSHLHDHYSVERLSAGETRAWRVRKRAGPR